MKLYYVAVADYSCGTYGAGNFGTECDANATGGVAGSPSSGTGTSTGTGGAGGVNGLLADTGYAVLLPVALGMAILTAAAILLTKRTYRRLAARRAE